MWEHSTPTSLLSELSKSYNTEIKLEANGTAAVKVDDDLVVNFEVKKDKSALYLYIVLGPLELEKREQRLMELLNANAFSSETCGVSFALDPVTEEMILIKAFEMKYTSFEMFEDYLRRIVAYARAWKEKGTGDWDEEDFSSQSNRPGQEESYLSVDLG